MLYDVQTRDPGDAWETLTTVDSDVEASAVVDEYRELDPSVEFRYVPAS